MQIAQCRFPQRPLNPFCPLWWGPWTSPLRSRTRKKSQPSFAKSPAANNFSLLPAIPKPRYKTIIHCVVNRNSHSPPPPIYPRLHRTRGSDKLFIEQAILIYLDLCRRPHLRQTTVFVRASVLRSAWVEKPQSWVSSIETTRRRSTEATGHPSLAALIANSAIQLPRKSRKSRSFPWAIS